MVADAVRASVASTKPDPKRAPRKEGATAKKSAFADRIREEVSSEPTSPVSERIRFKLGTRIGSDAFGRRSPRKEDE